MSNTLTINIGWEYFLGIMFGLIVVAWYSNGRFTALETSMEWVKEKLKDLKVASDNAATPVFAVHSPVSLNDLGKRFLSESGLKEFIDANKEFLLKSCKDGGAENPYKVQQESFKLMDEYKFDAAFYDRLQKFAFSKGATIDVLRRVGGIYLRDVCLEKFGMNKDDIDKHTPSNG